MLTFNLAQSVGPVWLDNIVLAPPPAATTPSAPSTRVPTVTPAPTTPSWTLVWDDEFNAARLDPSKWNVESDAPGGHSTCCLSAGLQYGSADDVTEANGVLRLTSEQRTVDGKRYTSGAVSTVGKFAFQYGRIDIRARLPHTQGFWTAFWLLPPQQDWQGAAPHEVDIVEMVGSSPRTILMDNHFGSQEQWCYYTGPDFSTGFHTFSLDWTPTSLSWSVDGVERCQIVQGVPDQPMSLLLNTYVGGP
jgi:beta-glucanase (GH16 family)